MHGQFTGEGLSLQARSLLTIVEPSTFSTHVSPGCPFSPSPTSYQSYSVQLQDPASVPSHFRSFLDCSAISYRSGPVSSFPSCPFAKTICHSQTFLSNSIHSCDKCLPRGAGVVQGRRKGIKRQENRSNRKQLRRHLLTKQRKKRERNQSTTS